MAIGAGIGAGAGIVAEKLIKANPMKPATNFVSNFQMKQILNKTAKDVFQMQPKGAKNIIEMYEKLVTALKQERISILKNQIKGFFGLG